MLSLSPCIDDDGDDDDDDDDDDVFIAKETSFVCK